jgi:single-stranded-DNA-specific exonuclease
MKISDKFNRPCILLNKSKDGMYRGSGRNTDRNNVKDLKYLLNSTGLIEGIGHAQAMGVNINDSVPKAINKINELLKDVEFNDDTYEVYFIIPFEDLEDELIFQIDLLKSIWGKGLEEPLIAIKNVEIKSNEIEVIGKKANTLKLTVDGVEFIKFNVDNSDELIKKTSDWEDNTDKIFTLDIVGSCSSNEWNGEKKPQIKIKNYNIISIK